MISFLILFGGAVAVGFIGIAMLSGSGLFQAPTTRGSSKTGEQPWDGQGR
jgi:hypothetical protein